MCKIIIVISRCANLLKDIYFHTIKIKIFVKSYKNLIKFTANKIS